MRRSSPEVGADKDAVTQEAAGADKGEVQEATFDPGDLESVTAYYWRVDEVLAGSNAATVTKAEWTAWNIPLSDFAGVNLSRVKKLTIGLGDKANPVAGGAGRIYLDDIRLTKPAQP